MSRPESQIKMGYYPFGDQLFISKFSISTVTDAIERVHNLFASVPSGAKIFDPFAGEGKMIKSFEKLGFDVYGNELDKSRASLLSFKLGRAKGFHSSFEEVTASRSGFQAAWINPPYDYDPGVPENRKEHYYVKEVLSAEFVQAGGYNFIVVYDFHLDLAFLQTFSRFNDFVDLWEVPGLHFRKHKQVILVGKQLPIRRDMRSANEMAYSFFDELNRKRKQLGDEKEIYHIPAPVEIKKFWYKPTRITPEALEIIINEEGAQLNKAFINDIESEQEFEIPQPIIAPNVGQLGGLIKAGLADGIIVVRDNMKWSVKTTYEEKEYETGEEVSYDKDGKAISTVINKKRKTIATTKLMSEEGQILQLGQELSFSDFITDHGDNLLEYLQKTYQPLFNMEDPDEPTWVETERILSEVNYMLKGKYQLFYNQRKVIAASVKKLIRDKGMILAGTMGVGKTAISYTTAYILFKMGYIKDDEFIFILNPKITKKNWYREILSTIPKDELNIVVADTIEQTADFMKSIVPGAGKLNIIIVDEYRAKATESRLFAGIWHKQFNKHRSLYLNPFATDSENKYHYEKTKTMIKYDLPNSYAKSDDFWWSDNGKLFKATGLGSHPIDRHKKKKKSHKREIEKTLRSFYMKFRNLQTNMDAVGKVFNDVFKHELSNEQIDIAHLYNNKFNLFKNRVEYGRFLSYLEWAEINLEINQLIKLASELPVDVEENYESIREELHAKRNDMPSTHGELKKLRSPFKNKDSFLPHPIYQNIRAYSALENQNKFDHRAYLTLVKTIDKQKFELALDKIAVACKEILTNSEIEIETKDTISRLARPLKRLISENKFYEFQNNLSELYKYIKFTPEMEKALNYITLKIDASSKKVIPLPQVIRPDLDDPGTWIMRPDQYIIYNAHPDRQIETVDGEPYQYKRVNSAISITEYMTHKANGKMAMLIADEAHLYRNLSARGVAFLQLASRAKYKILPTGTQFSGKVSSLFFLLYAVAPEKMSRFEFSESGLSKFIDYMGVRDIKLTISRKQDKRGHIAKSTSTSHQTVSEGPGSNERLLRLTLFTSLTFLLEELYSPYDLNPDGTLRKLVDYQEVVIQSQKDPVIWEHIKPTLEDVVNYQMQCASRNDGSFAGKFFHALWSIPRAHYHDDLITHRRLIPLEEWEKESHSLLKQGFKVIDNEYYQRGEYKVLIENVVTHYYGIPTISKEEKELAINVQAGIKQNRGQCVFIRQSGKNMQDRIKYVLEKLIPEAKCIIMTDTNPADNADRQEFVINNMKPVGEYNVFISNTQLVEVGLNLLPLVDIHNYELMSTYTTMAQASRRSLRADQENDVKVYYYLSSTPTCIAEVYNNDKGIYEKVEILDGPPIIESLMANGLSRSMTSAKYISGETLTDFNEVGDDNDMESDMMKEARAAALRIIQSDRFGQSISENYDSKANAKIIRQVDTSVFDTNEDGLSQQSMFSESPQPGHVVYYNDIPEEADATYDKIFACYKGVMQDGEDIWVFAIYKNSEEGRFMSFSFMGGPEMGELGWHDMKDFYDGATKRIDAFAKDNWEFYPGIELDILKRNFDMWIESLYKQSNNESSTVVYVEPEPEPEPMESISIEIKADEVDMTAMIQSSFEIEMPKQEKKKYRWL